MSSYKRAIDLTGEPDTQTTKKIKTKPKKVKMSNFTATPVHTVAPASEFNFTGYMVVPFMDAASIAKARDDFDKEVRCFPETTPACEEEPIEEILPVLGGFAALSNPSSFHNQTVRAIRTRAHPVALQAVRDAGLLQSDEEFFEQIPDRMMIRAKGLTASAESWHRDQTPSANDDDTVMGGWVNLDDKPQYFSCVPGSHKGVSGKGHGGFATIPKTEHADLRARSAKVCIPPGHVLIFNEQLIHEVFSKRMAYTSYRLFLAWRVTDSWVPLVKDITDRLADQAPITLKSGQFPPMYAVLHWTNWRDRLALFSNRFNPLCTELRTVKKTGDEHMVVHRQMKSLKEYGFKRYPSYTPEEMKMYKPAVY